MKLKDQHRKNILTPPVLVIGFLIAVLVSINNNLYIKLSSFNKCSRLIMQKWLIFTIMVVFLVAPVLAIKDCMTVQKLTNKDIPCMIISTWNYTNDCTTYNISFYNSTPEFIGATYLSNYSETGRCNATFNFSTKGSYLFKINNGESGRILVESEGDEMIIAIITIGLILLFLGFMLKITNKVPLKTLYTAMLFFFLLIATNFSRAYLVDSNANAGLISMLNIAYIVLLWVTILVMFIMLIEVIIWAVKTIQQKKEENELNPF